VILNPVSQGSLEALVQAKTNLGLRGCRQKSEDWSSEAGVAMNEVGSRRQDLSKTVDQQTAEHSERRNPRDETQGA